MNLKKKRLPKHYEFFLPWVGLEKTQIYGVKAVKQIGQLYNLVLADNPVKTDKDRHVLNIFLSRLLFCYFAEDTGIFEQNQFTNGIISHTKADGSDLQEYLEKVFHILSRPKRNGLPKYLAEFLFVNGGLFAEEYPVPKFSRKSRQIIIECGSLDWRVINLDIFGSMIQAVVRDKVRSNLGMYYTSVVNIMKVIGPLFLNDLREQLESAGKNKKKLERFLNRLYYLRIFDPACGSGNFLVVAFKELRKLEIKAFQRLYGKQQKIHGVTNSNICLSHFYGIELDDFACKIAKMSLWLVDHQMNLVFKDVFGECRPTLPLRDSGNVFNGNAAVLDWRTICPIETNTEVFVLGNPPYLGYKGWNKQQKHDMQTVFDGMGAVKRLDYVACWFKKATDYIDGANAQFAFVSTNSISQGEQVALIWPYILSKNLEIGFAHTSFRWQNCTRNGAGVSCVIIGIRSKTNSPKRLYSESWLRHVNNISPYLTAGNNTYVSKRKTQISNLPDMALGSSGIDGNHLILSLDDRERFVKDDIRSEEFIRPYIGGNDFLSGKQRFCLWIDDDKVDLANDILLVQDRIEKCRKYREQGGRDARKGAKIPHRFFYRKYQDGIPIILPFTSSEDRAYLPVGYEKPGTIISNGLFVIYDAKPWMFALLCSKLHWLWTQMISGKLETRIRYSVNLVYNNFPFLNVSEIVFNQLTNAALEILDAREQYSELTLAELYDPSKMPLALVEAHKRNDDLVKKCYLIKNNFSDEECLESLLRMYSKIISSQ